MSACARKSASLFCMMSTVVLIGVVLPSVARAGGPSVGSLFDIATTASEEVSLTAAFDGTNFLVGIQGDAVKSYNLVAQRIGSGGSLIGGAISTGLTGGAPFVAFGGSNYLIALTNDATTPDDDIYGQLISPSGALAGAAFPISADTGEEEVLGVAFNGSNFLVVWRNEADDGLYGRLVSTSGTLVGSRLSLGERSGPTAASVASDGQDFLVVWQRYTFEAGDPHDILGRIVSGSGTLGSAFIINVSRSPSYNPVAVACNGSHYLVAWNHDTGPGYPNPSSWDVLGRRVSTSGSVVGSELTLASGSGDQIILPCGLASDGDGFFVTWFSYQQEDMTTSDVYGQLLDSSGAAQGDAVLIAGGAGGQIGCGVSYGAGQYLCVINDGVAGFDAFGDVAGVFVNPDDDTSAVYRFWSSVNSRHFYTIKETERDKLINTYSHVWTYEGQAYRAYASASEDGLAPVYRFWSEALGGHFYTIKTAERDKLINNYSDVWTYEGPAFYAYPDGSEPGDASPVYRFWSESLGGHFYTIDEAESNKLITTYSHVWTFEGIAWYAFE